MRAFLSLSLRYVVLSSLLWAGCATPERESCGDGTVQVGEICDGNCPSDCNDGNACTIDGLNGKPSTCDAKCVYEDVVLCHHGDGCCPAGCTHSDDSDCPAWCGNGQIEEGEICDRNCPTDCNDGNACTSDVLTGSADNCNAACSYQPIVDCIAGDGCCAAGCDSSVDSDCSVTCGNDTIETGETCDGNCPTDCNDGNACTLDNLTGSAANCSAVCAYQAIQQCTDGDGCCPAGCTSNSDADCSVSCGNGTIEDGESCDGNCPADCNDANACTLDNLTGSAANCSAICTHQTIQQCVPGDGCCPAGCSSLTDSDCSASCGNGVIEVGETCDGDCPENCDDGYACTIDSVTGSVDNCSAACSYQTIQQCQAGDGCCPAGCNSNTDADCSASCGNGTVEDGETCDGNCPSDCNDGSACTMDELTGSAGNCSASCSHQIIQECVAGDGCCPAACNSNNDSDCSSSCGNDVIEDGETCDGNCPAGCDDGNACTIDSLTGSAENCSAACITQTIQQCVAGDGCCPAGCNSINDLDCSASCGNDVTEDGETCDGNCPVDCNDGNACTVDSLTGSAANCSAACVYQTIQQCVAGDGCCPAGCNSINDSDCSASCGNHVVEQGETCDGNCPIQCNDDNPCTIDTLTGSADNCSAQCLYQTVQQCASGDGCCPAGCNSINDTDCSASCGNDVIEDGETCDGNCPSDCGDGNACTVDSLIGSAGNCSAECIHSTVLSCLSGDGCCPAGCTEFSDSDCGSATCPVNPVSIYQIQNESLGNHAPESCAVEVNGVVVTSQVFSAGGQDSFYVQEPDGGPYSGLYVYGDGIDASGLQIGDIVSVSGVHTEYYGMTEIVAHTVVHTGSGQSLAPELVFIEQIGETGYESEAYEGVFVRVELVETIETPYLSYNGLDYGDFLVIDTATYFDELVIGWQMKHAFACPETEMGETCNTDYRQMGQTLNSVQGILNFSYGHYRLQPRSITDIDFVGSYDTTRLLLKESLNHHSIGYDSARYQIYSNLDNNAGQVEAVYTGHMVSTWDIPDPAVMNTEHTWPQSQGTDSGPANSDMHHLFPVMTATNSARSNHPFGMVDSNITWSDGGSYKGTDINGYTVFQVRPEHRGDAARAKFYVAIRYDMNIPFYEEPTLRQWHAEDPPDADELARNTAIQLIQRNRNPFIDNPGLVDVISDF